MSFFLRKPSCKDIGYVLNTYQAINNSYPDYKEINKELNDPLFEDFNAVKEYISSIGSQFDFEIRFENIDELEGDFLGIPYIFNVLEDQNKKVVFGITPFGLSSPNIAVCELILFLIDYKITNDGFIYFESDFYNDYENQYRPFLVLASIYFGFGFVFLRRFWVSGNYINVSDPDFVLEFKYYVPLEINYLIFAITYNAFLKNTDEDLIKLTNNFNSNIKNEIKICLKYLIKKKGNLNIESENPFFWRKNL